MHQAWCGPCTALEPTYRKLFLQLEQPEERLRICSLDSALMTDAQRSSLPAGSAAGCRPLLLLYKVGRRRALPLRRACLSALTRRTAAATLTLAALYHPPLQQRALVGHVVGANAPSLESQILENISEAEPSD